MKSRFLVAALALVAPALPSFGQAYTPPPSMTEIDAVRENFKADRNHLQAIRDFRELADKYADSRRDIQAVAQFLGFQASFLGNEQEALNAFTRHLFGNRLPRGERMPLPERPDAAPLRDVIVSLAADSRLVLINEAHHVSRHRATTRSLLAPLRDAGFGYLAIEALHESGRTLTERGYPIATSGNYLNDPVFADMVREAIRLGYVIVRYEPKNERDQHERERRQAEAIAEVLKDDPDARVLVHAGYQHIEESGLLFGARTMAQQLEEITSQEVVTVNQTTLTWIGTSMEPNAVYANAVAAAGDLQQPFVLQTAAGPWSLEPEKYDVSVITPPSTYLPNGRPAWLSALGERQALRMGVPAGAGLVEARPEGEPATAVPLDRVEIRSKAVTLYLPPGSYRLTWRDESGKTVRAETVTAPAS